MDQGRAHSTQSLDDTRDRVMNTRGHLMRLTRADPVYGLTECLALLTERTSQFIQDSVQHHEMTIESALPTRRDRVPEKVSRLQCNQVTCYESSTEIVSSHCLRLVLEEELSAGPESMALLDPPLRIQIDEDW